MIRTSGFIALTAAILAVSACGGGDDNNGSPATPQAKVAVDDLNTGSYVVSVGDVNAPTVGKYYAGADGSRLLVVADANDRASQLYRRAASAAWVAVPAPEKDVTLTLLRSDAAPASPLTLAAVSGSYTTLLSDGSTADFTVTANGDITAGTSTCKLTGKMATGTLPDSLQLTLTTAGCAVLPASSVGAVTADRDYAPARFRLVADSGAQLVDLWAFSQ